MRMALVALNLYILVIKRKQILDLRIQHQTGQRVRLARKLQLDLLDMVMVDMGIAQVEGNGDLVAPLFQKEVLEQGAVRCNNQGIFVVWNKVYFKQPAYLQLLEIPERVSLRNRQSR